VYYSTPKTLFALLLSLPLLLSACSKKQRLEENSGADSSVFRLSLSSEAEVDRFVSRLTIQCPTQGCPSNVGVLSVKAGTDAILCTATVIGKKQIITNSHCLPKFVKETPELCAEWVTFSLNSAAGTNEFDCAKVLWSSTRPNAISPDLAVLEMKQTLPPALTPVLSGIKPHTKLSALTFAPLPGQKSIVQFERKDCVSVNNSYRFPWYRNEESSVALLGDCNSIPGNSGSPIVDESNQMVGVLQASLPLSDSQRKAWTPHLLENEAFSPLALATSSFCLSFSPELQAEPSLKPSCLPLDEEQLSRPRISDLPIEIPAQWTAARTTLPKEYKWSSLLVSERALERKRRIYPACVQPFQFWSQPPENSLSVDSELTILTLEEKIFFNRYLQIFPKAIVTSSVAKIRLNISSLAEFGWTEFDSSAEAVGLSRIEMCSLEPSAADAR
jgi:V8-like Glu-specific endopeptidase